MMIQHFVVSTMVKKHRTSKHSVESEAGFQMFDRIQSGINQTCSIGVVQVVIFVVESVFHSAG